MAIQTLKDAIIDAEKFDQYKPGNRGAYSPNAGNTPGANRYGGPKVDVNVRGPRGVFNDALNRGQQQSAYRRTAQDRGMGRAARTPGAGSGGARAGGIPKSGTVGYNKPPAGGGAGGTKPGALRRAGGWAAKKAVPGLAIADAAFGVPEYYGTDTGDYKAFFDSQVPSPGDTPEQGFFRDLSRRATGVPLQALDRVAFDAVPDSWYLSEQGLRRKQQPESGDAAPAQPAPSAAPADTAPSPEHLANMQTIRDYEARQAEAYRTSLRNAMQGGEARDARDPNTGQVAGFKGRSAGLNLRNYAYEDDKGNYLKVFGTDGRPARAKGGGTVNFLQGPGGAYDPTMSRQENIQRNVDAYDRQTAALKSLREAQRYDKQGNYIRTPEEVDEFYRQAREEAAATPGYGERLALRNAAVSRDSGNKAAFAAEAASRKDARDKQLAGVIAENEAQAEDGSGKASLRDQIALAQLQRSLGQDAYERQQDAAEASRLAEQTAYDRNRDQTGDAFKIDSEYYKRGQDAADRRTDIIEDPIQRGYQDIAHNRMRTPEAEVALPELGKTLREQTNANMGTWDVLRSTFGGSGPELPNERTGPSAEWMRQNLVPDEKGNYVRKSNWLQRQWWYPNLLGGQDAPYYMTTKKGYDIPKPSGREGAAFDRLRQR